MEKFVADIEIKQCRSLFKTSSKMIELKRVFNFSQESNDSETVRSSDVVFQGLVRSRRHCWYGKKQYLPATDTNPRRNVLYRLLAVSRELIPRRSHIAIVLAAVHVPISRSDDAALYLHHPRSWMAVFLRCLRLFKDGHKNPKVPLLIGRLSCCFART